MALLLTRYMGELAALAAAMIWSVSSMIWAQLSRKLTALELNLLKGLLAGVMFLGAMAVLGEFMNQVAPLAFILLCISGFIGIGLGDTAYMKALQAIGARRTLLMATLSPPMTGIIAWIFLGETLPLRAWVGILITILGVGWVITERTPQAENTPNNLRAGILFGLISGLTQAVGSVLSRFAFMHTDISLLASALIRMSAGSLLLIVWLITLLANQSILVHNLKNKDDARPLLTEDEVELLTTPFDLAGYKAAITEALYRGTKRNIESEAGSKNVAVG